MRKIPIVDLSEAQNSSRDRVVSQVANACAQWGFFQVVNHGISNVLIDQVWDQTRHFFDQPVYRKRSLMRSRENARGYYDRELTKNTRDLKEVFDFGVVSFPDLPHDHPQNRDLINGYNLWPEDLPDFKSTMMCYLAACEKLGWQLLELFSLGLGADADEIRSSFDPVHTGFIRLNYYPVDDPLSPHESGVTGEPGNMALNHHSDAGALTILLQDEVGGLQVFAHGEWLDVNPIPEALVINTADMMQVWSNDRYQAPLHRVLPVTRKPRYSVPFFFNPAYECNCEPLEVLTMSDGAHYRAVNWGEYRQLRTDGDYADYGKEVQLDDYRIQSAVSNAPHHG